MEQVPFTKYNKRLQFNAPPENQMSCFDGVHQVGGAFPSYDDELAEHLGLLNLVRPASGQSTAWCGTCLFCDASGLLLQLHSGTR